MRITQKDLPLNSKKLSVVKDFCQERKDSNQLVVMGDISYTLRQDYLDKNLPFPDRAIKNITVSSEDWRAAMINECDKIANKVIDDYGKNVWVVYTWRAALPFIFSFVKQDIKKHCHMGISRDEKETHKTKKEWMELDYEKFSDLKENHTVVISDPMNATGGSLDTVIKKLQGIRIKEKQIILANILAAPEGVYNLLNEYRDIKIITVALDNNLNEFGFIQPGIGDAGDKFIYESYLSYFNPVRPHLNEKEWGELEKRIKMANLEVA